MSSTEIDHKTGSEHGPREAILNSTGYPSSRPQADGAARTLRVLVVVPAYNESKQIPKVLRELREEAPWADVVVVDDDSLDGTSAVARNNGARVLRLPINLGVGGAMQTGYLYGSQNGYDVVVQFDGDGQHCADQIPILIRELEAGTDVVIGSRLLGEASYRFPFSRWLGSRLLAGLIRVLAGRKMTDPTSGFRAVSRKAARFLAAYCPQGYMGDTEAMVMAAWHGMSVEEVAARMRMSERSSIGNLKGLLHMLRICLALLINRIEERLPMPEEPTGQETAACSPEK